MQCDVGLRNVAHVADAKNVTDATQTDQQMQGTQCNGQQETYATHAT